MACFQFGTPQLIERNSQTHILLLYLDPSTVRRAPSRPTAGRYGAPPEEALQAKPLNPMKPVTKVPEGTDSRQLANTEDQAPVHRLRQRTRDELRPPRSPPTIVDSSFRHTIRDADLR